MAQQARQEVSLVVPRQSRLSLTISCQRSPCWMKQRLLLAGRVALIVASLFFVVEFWDSPSPSSATHSHLRLRELQENDTCTQSCCDTLAAASPNPLNSIPFAVQVILIIILICFSALFSGLTLGLLGLDKTGLEIVMDGDDVKNAEYARRIYPLRKRGNLLLCTLLLGNVAVNALASILLADKAGGLVGFFASTFLIVIFGEILPQAICSRHALRIGSATIPLVRVIVILLLPVSFPLAWLLDKMLGEELATTYSGAEMLKMLQIHVNENVLDQETAVAMTGALKYKDIAVRDVMTPVANTFMLSVDDRLNFETIATIFKTGFSRIPVYEINKNNVIGLLFVKDLIFIDPEDGTRVADFIEIFGRALHVVWADDKLGDVLRELKQGRSHMALVRDVNNEDETQDPFYELKGIITLEDIIEEILGDEIVDETDAFVDSSQMVKVDRGETFRWASLRLLDTKIVDQTLTFDEARAVTAHLLKNYSSAVELLTEHQLHKLVAETPVTVLPTAEQEVGQILPSDLMYEKDVPSDLCTLIVTGKVTVLAGADNFRSDVSSWCLLGAGALSDSNYTPDFSAFVSSGPCRCIRISRSRFAAAVDASATERRTHHTASVGVGSELPALNTTPFGTDKDSISRKEKLLTALQVVATKPGIPVKSKAPHGTIRSAPTSRRSSPGPEGRVHVPRIEESLDEAPDDAVTPAKASEPSAPRGKSNDA